MQENFYQINAVIAVLFLVVYGLLLQALINHMREMVRLKYHADERAEFDESRVKIIIASIFMFWVVYLVVWIFSLTGLDLDIDGDYQLASSLFKAITATMLVGSYAIFFLNNRIKGDIKHIKRTITSAQDQSQNVLNHL